MKKHTLCLILLFALIGACDNENSYQDLPVTATRYAYECLSMTTGENPITIINSCDYNVIFRELPEYEPVKVLALKETSYKPNNDSFIYGACQAPYTPVSREKNKFDCQ